jgi:hydrogenase expression/formation protein HypC
MQRMCLAAPAQVVSINGNEAIVDYNGVRSSVRLDALSVPPAVGDYVLIHTGFAIQRLSEEDAQGTLRLFDEFLSALEAGRYKENEADQEAR